MDYGSCYVRKVMMNLGSQHTSDSITDPRLQANHIAILQAEANVVRPDAVPVP